MSDKIKTPEAFLIAQGKTREEARRLLAQAAGGPSDEVLLKDQSLSITMTLVQWAAVLDALEAVTEVHVGQRVPLHHSEAEAILKKELLA